jgi:hypothetical protein
MFWINTKLLFRLYYRPVSAMSAIIDEGHWLYAAISVVAISLLLQAAITSLIYSSYEAIYRPLPETVQQQTAAHQQAAPQPQRPVPPGYPTAAQQFAAAEYARLGLPAPNYVFDQKPMPLVGKYGWWLVSFAPGSFGTTVIGIAVLYVPCLILLAAMYGSVGSFSVALRRDYGPMLTCALMAWTAGHLPFVLAGLALPALGLGVKTALVLWILSALCFGVLMAFGVRTLFGIGLMQSLLVVCIAALAFSAQGKLFSVVSPFMFSPFLLYYAYGMFRGDIGDIGFSLRQRQSFRRSMEAATINPRDASAHYQLGLVFQYRRQYTEAIERFKRAVEIANDETDAHFQLGRIAREQNRLQDAIDQFAVVLSQDDKHAHSEIWREIGATYLAAGMFSEAKDALETFVERRAYDPEGLYYYGKTLEQLGQDQEAHEAFVRCLEAVKTMPDYRRRDQRRWRKLAQERLSVRVNTPVKDPS